MVETSGDLKQAELKKDTLFKAYEQLQSQLSSFLSLTHPWKNLEEHLDGVRRSLERRSQELDEGERSLAERARAVAEREEGLRSALQRVEECEEEVRRKKMDLKSVEEWLEKCRGEHREEESQLVVKRDALRECISLIRDHKNQLSDLKQKTEECRRDYQSKKDEVEVLRQELDSKEKKVRGVQSLLDENAQELEVKVQELGSVKRALDECSRTVKATSEELTAVQRLLNHSLKAHDESEKRLSVLERTIQEHDKEVTVKAGKLLSLENKVNGCQVELRAKEEELKGIHKSMEERSKELQCKEGELLSMDISIEKHKEELKSKREEFEKMNKLINERLAAIALKDRELGSIQTSIGKLSKELKSKEGEMEYMVKRVKQWNEEAKSKKEDIASVQAKLEEVAKSLELKSREFNAVQASIKDSNLELALKKRQLESIQIDIAERAEQLRLKEKEYASIQSSTLECPKTLEFKKKQCSLGSTQQWQIKTEEPENFSVHNADDSSLEYRPPPTILARTNLQLFQTELSNENAMLCKEIAHMLQNSSDPAKLVLDVIAGSCIQYSNSRDKNLQTNVRRSHIVLLEQLVGISPSITQEVKERAMKLAREWKAKLSDRPESTFEVLAFQRFLVAYDLLSLFNDAPLFGQTLDLVNEITVNIAGASPASTMYTPTFQHQKVFPTQGASRLEVGHKGTSNPENDRPDVFRKTQARPEKVNKRRNRRQVVESSESYDSGSSRESDEDSVICADRNFQGSQNVGLPLEQSVWRSTQQKQQVSYKENLSDDEDTNPAKRSKGGSPSPSTEEDFEDVLQGETSDFDGKDGLVTNLNEDKKGRKCTENGCSEVAQQMMPSVS